MQINDSKSGWEYYFRRIFDFDFEQQNKIEVRNNIVAGYRISMPTLVILGCSIIIASIGLNNNAAPVIIGAMLISPLMGPIIAMGYTIVAVDGRNFRFATSSFLIQVIIAIVLSTLFFLLSPVVTKTPEIIARTHPTIWDILIAFFGGLAGAIANVRKDKMVYAISGVSIATALMPPLCTVGFGIAQNDIAVIIGAGLLFFINTFFIILSTMFVVSLLKLSIRTAPEAYKKKMTIRFIILGLLIATPATYLTYQVYQSSEVESAIQRFAKNKVQNEQRSVVQLEYNTNKKVIHMAIVGAPISSEEQEQLSAELETYHLSEYKLTFTQSTLNNQNGDVRVKDTTLTNTTLTALSESEEDVKEYVLKNSNVAFVLQSRDMVRSDTLHVDQHFFGIIVVVKEGKTLDDKDKESIKQYVETEFPETVIWIQFISEKELTTQI